MLGLAAGEVHAQASDYVGRPIVDLIEHLRQQDIRIVYSERLLPARYRVRAQTADGTAFEQLDAVLAPYGLGLERGPRDTWLVVRSAAPAASNAAAGSAIARIVPPSPLETIVVTASRYSVQQPNSVSTTTVGRHMLENTPALGQDPIRVTQNLPGITSNQLTSKMHIRGGDLNEALITLDGVRLYSPYHLKDFQSVFSSINPRVIESMDIRTGGFEARYGDVLSGVIDMESIMPTEPRRYELALTFLDSSILSSGLFADGRGAWVTTLRRGNLDVLVDLADSDIGQPQYVDFFNKLSYAVSPNWTLSLGVLTQDDKITLNDGSTATSAAGYDDSYVWLKANHSGENGLESDLVLSTTSLKRTRVGSIDDPSRVIGTLSEDRELHGQSLNASWSLPLADRLYATWGLEVSSIELNYNFESARTLMAPFDFADLSDLNAPPAQAGVILDQTRRALHMNFRVRLTPYWITDFGARWDAQSVTDEQQTSPRISMLFDLTDRTHLRLAWGDYFQAHDPTELAVADGSLQLLPAEKSTHRIIGLEHFLGQSVTLRAEIYRKDVSRQNHRFENIVERVTLIPELLPDRFEIEPLSARIRGYEVSVEGGTEPFSWWANVARSRSQDRLARGYFDRSWDEQWSLKAGGEWAGPKWTVTASAVLRSGWPISALELAADGDIEGRFNRERLADFTSLNARASRTVTTAHGEFDWFVEITNLLDRTNYCCLDYRYTPAAGSEPATLSSQREGLLGIVPNLGVRWQF